MSDIPSVLHETLAGRYVLKREIGRGGAATVYLAHDVRHERLVAIKLLHRELSHALGAQRFLREIKLTASLQHPHILSIHDSGEIHEQLFYVMPYVEGESLRQRLGGDNRLSIEASVRIGREVGGALAYAHERGVVHRDIKPENILFSGGHAVLADFGIARAINRAHEKITHQGTITGTPAYMSPEQARDRPFDGRSDVYSLACVLYECIAGVPPFVGETPQQLLTQRFTRTAPLLRQYRHDIPPQIEAVIAKALAISPDDRFDDARAFSAALSTAIGNSGETVAARVARRPLTKSPWLWAGAAAIMMTGGAASTTTGRDRIDVLTGRVDVEQYAVLPFQYVGAPAPAGDQEPVSQGLYAAMREWDGLKLAGDMTVNDAVRRADGQSLSGLMSAARHSHAGRAIWGRIWLTRDSIRIRAVVYDAINGISLRELPLSGPRDLLEKHPGVLRNLAADLLRLNDVPKAALSGDIGTRSLVAWHAYQEGQRSLAGWRVPEAIAAFERAVLADPDYPHPHTWLAQLILWRADPPAQWAPHLSAAVRNRASLGDRESELVDALQAIQANRYGDACEAYQSMRSRDSLDVAAWLGLTHCQVFDKLVVRNSSTTSGWQFRGSVASAQRAYARAMQIAPAAFSAFPYRSLQSLYTVEANVYHVGTGSDSAEFFGLPQVIRDSIAFIPHPIRDLPGRGFDVLAPTVDKALQKNRDNVLALLSDLTQRLPDNADVFESLARVLESRADISGTPNGGYSALSALERAIALATDSLQRVRLGAFDVRLHLKLGDFARTAAIGDSVLRANPATTGRTGQYLAGIASLLGRETLAVKYLRGSGESITMIGAPSSALVEDVATALFIRAALGVCDDSLRTLKTRVESLLESYVNASQRTMARAGVLARPVTFAFGCLGPADALSIKDFNGPGLTSVQSLARGDARRTSLHLDSLGRSRGVLRPGDVALDVTVTEASIRAIVGDTIAAMRQLDLTLTALPTLSSYLVREPGMAASLGRAMVLRADLAFASKDQRTAALWAGRVLTLWAQSDESLKPTLRRMRTLTAVRM